MKQVVTAAVLALVLNVTAPAIAEDKPGHNREISVSLNQCDSERGGNGMRVYPGGLFRGVAVTNRVG